MSTHNTFVSKLGSLAVLLLTLVCTGAGAQNPQTTVKGFIANVGQWPSEVLFAHRDGNLDIWITQNGIVFDQFEVTRAADKREGEVVRLGWTGSKGGSPTGEVYLPAQMNFFIGNNPSAWYTNVPVYSKVRVDGIYRGVDAIYYMDNGHVRYDLEVHPGADLAAIGMSVEGGNGVTIDPEKISIATDKGTIVMTDLFAYFLNDKPLQTAARFVTRPNGFGIDVPDHTSEKSLLIDPVVYGTFVGGDAYDRIVGVESVSGGVVVGGSTEGMSFPTGTGGYQSNLQSGLDAFVALLSKDLRHVLRYSYYGGSGVDRMKALTIDAAGSAYFVGETNSPNLPISIGAAGQIYRAQFDCFIVKLDSVLTKLEVSTYVGGNKDDLPTSIAVDYSGNIFIAGGTNSTADFPTTLGHQKTMGGQIDGFLCRLSPNGSTYGFSTYFGKEGIETFTALALNSSGEPFVTGSTTSANFETAPTPARFSSGRLPYDRTYNGGNTDAFVIKWFSDGTLSKRDDGTYSTYFGGAGDDAGTGLFVDLSGRAVVVGTTTSTNLPALGTFVTQAIGQRDIFMAILADDGRALVGCTYFGGTGNDNVAGVRPLNTTATGVLYGTTTSNDFPTFGAGAETNRNGQSDGFITVLNTASLIHSTLVGGSSTDTVNAIALNSNADIFYSLTSQSPDLFVSDSAYSKTNSGNANGYVGKYAFGTLAIQSPSGGETWCAGSTNAITWGVEEMLVNEKYQVELSTDAGTTWTILAKDVVARSYAWKPGAGAVIGPSYRIRISTSRGHASTSGVFTLNQGPSISAQPADAAACIDSPVELAVAASGTGLKYQWRRNGANIAGATASRYSIASLTTANSGSYDCVVSGSCNPSVTSRSTAVSVAQATAITVQPESKSVEQGKTLTLYVTATGSTLAYQWNKDGTPITGATRAEYKVMNSALTDAGKYSCDVTGGCGRIVSAEATVTIAPTTSIVADDLASNSWARLVGPIPSDDYVMVQTTLDQPANATAHIYNEQGRLVAVIRLGVLSNGESLTRISLAQCPPGLYSIELEAGAHVGSFAAIIKR